MRLEVLRHFICWLGSMYIKLVFATSKWETINKNIPEAFWQYDTPFILCFWHGRLLMMPCCWDLSKKINLLTSLHKDGQLISKTVSHFGFKFIKGSTTKGGARAMRNILKTLELGECIGLTPDGPRGPRMVAKDGVISIASLSGVPIIPITYSIVRGKNLDTWDNFLLAFPFSRGIFVWGDPIFVEKNVNHSKRERIRKEIENELIKITNEADKLMGRKLIKPIFELNKT